MNNWGRILWIPVWCHQTPALLCSQHSHVPQSWYQGQRWHLGDAVCDQGGLTQFLWGHRVPPTPRESSQGRSVCPHHSSIPPTQQANKYVVCEYTSQQTGKQWATKTNYWQNPSVNLAANPNTRSFTRMGGIEKRKCWFHDAKESNWNAEQEMMSIYLLFLCLPF